MRRLVAFAMSFFLCIVSTVVLAAEDRTVGAVFGERPSCVMMKFTNATRFKALDSDEVFAELVLEKLLATRRFNIKEMQPIEENLEKMLYDEKARAAQGVLEAKNGGKLHALFDAGTNSKNAASISNAKVGQVLPLSVTSAIGKKHQADYLIQGTIVNLGGGRKEGSYWFGTSASASIGVVADLRIIRAATGEVIWVSRATGAGKQDSTSIAGVTVGEAKLNSNLYSRAMEEAAEQLVSAMLADMDARKLFFRERMGAS